MKKFAAALALALAAVAGAASASTITIKTGGTFESGLADGDAYRTAVTAAVSTSAAQSISSYGSLDLTTLSNFALESTISFYVTSPTTFDFRVGVDFGGGGALFLDGVLLDSKSTDMWWAYSYGDSNQFLSSPAGELLAAGGHTLSIYGFEGCCSGYTQAQYSVDGKNYTSFSSTDGLPAIPEAQTYAMLLAGLGLVSVLARRRSGSGSQA
jgi:hypothetical protein